MTQITDTETRGMNTPYAGNTPFNAIDAQIQKALQNTETIFLANIKKLHTQSEKGASYVDAQNIIQMTDQNGKTYKAPIYEKIPHYRYQAGIAAFIVDPAQDDIGVFACAKRDISNVTQSNHDPQQPASFRGFSASDAIQIATIHTKDPVNFIHLKQSKDCHWVIPEGILGETNKTVEWKVGKDVIQDIQENRTEKIGKNRDITISGTDSLKVEKTQDITIQQKQTITIKADQSQTIEGKQDKKVNGNVTVQIGGNKHITISGNCDVTINGSCNLQVTGNCTVKAPSIILDASSVNCTGNVTVSGTVTASDCLAGSISLLGHTHTGTHGETTPPH